MSPARPGASGLSTPDPDVLQRLLEVEQEILSRLPETAIDPTLDTVREALDLLGDPQRAYPVIHLTGTNGKTSTSRMVDALLRAHGLTVGRFTSPHLHSFRERITIGGEPISPDRLIEVYDEVKPIVDLVDERAVSSGGRRLNFFMLTVVLAYVAFADAPVDVAVVEVGIGGTWDATNVADGQVAVVTPIAVDHARILGSEVDVIAEQKAGIIKPGAIAVSAVQESDAAEVLVERAEQVGARIVFEDNDFGVTERDVAVGGQQLSIRGLAGEYPDLYLPLHGSHQAGNAATALAAVEAFLGGGERRLDLDVVRQGFADVTSPGRLEVVRRSPTILVDAAHNPAGMTALRTALAESFTFNRLVAVVAVFADKDADAMLQILEPAVDAIVVTRNTSPRSLSPERLAEVARGYFDEDRVHVVDLLPDALDLAVTLAEEDGIGGGVIVTGSVITAADARLLLGATDT